LPTKDRREANRFPIRLPLTIRWSGRNHFSEVATVSSNVSARSVYFLMSHPVEAGVPIEIVMTLPHELTRAGPVRVRCLGRVQRTEPFAEGRLGVVAAIERYEFLRGDVGAA
jgi:hypothetical protein